MAILEVRNLEKHFGPTRVLEDISFELEQGKALAVIGSSGSGKTTLLRCLNFLETPDRGTISVQGEVLFDAADPSTQREADIRRKRLHFGMVFQSFNLFPQYTALQNVTLACQLLAREQPDFKARRKEIFQKIDERGMELLTEIGLANRATHYPHQLSGGQQQRVAIARALALFALRSAAVSRSGFYTIGACTAAGILLIQVILNALGTVDIVPLTGVTFPFLSNGGSSMICTWGLLAFVKAADTRQNASFAVPLRRKRRDEDE